jgi:hypothetical protein
VVRKVLFMAAVAAATVFALSASPVAGAWSCSDCTPPDNAVQLQPQADLVFAFPGNWINVGLAVRCAGVSLDGVTFPLGDVHVDANQSPAQSANGVGTAAGGGDSTVRCDGTFHKIVVTVLSGAPEGWNVGWANAAAVLFGPASSTGGLGPQLDTDMRAIQIVG